MSAIAGAKARSETRSRALYEEACRHIPGGVNSPVRAMRSVGRTHPLFIARAQGAWVEDADGNRYVDLVGSWGPMILGHSHPEVVAAVQAQRDFGARLVVGGSGQRDARHVGPEQAEFLKHAHRAALAITPARSNPMATAASTIDGCRRRTGHSTHDGSTCNHTSGGANRMCGWSSGNHAPWRGRKRTGCARRVTTCRRRWGLCIADLLTLKCVGKVGHVAEDFPMGVAVVDIEDAVWRAQ